jgi:hypothetical protein
MGCDGGTIPKRCEMVREKKKPEKVDKEIELNAKWFHCAISQQELCEPIVCCELGNLYRKESVLEYLLDKSKATTDIAKHIRSLKDVKQLVLTKKIHKVPKNLKSNGHAADSYLDFQASDYICPISGLEMNGRYRFCFSWKCGCVFSERGLKEVPSTTCHSCGTPFTEEDVVIINGGENDVTKMQKRMLERQQKAKEEKRLKKSKRANGEALDTAPKESKKSKIDTSSSVSQTASSTLKSESNTKPPKSKLKSSSTVTKAESSSNGDTTLAYSKYKSVAENPEASKVFKSLFSSSHKEKPGQKAHWVTYQSYHC